jgi:sugar phosphate permease
MAGAGRSRYRIFAIICFSYILVYFHRLCPAVIALDMQESFAATATLLGVLGSAYFYPYAIMQLPAGLLVDSWGPRKTVSIFFLLAAGGSVLMGVASTLSPAILGRLLVGVGVSTLFVSNFKLLAEWFTPREFVVMGGIFMAMGGVGALSSSAPLAWLSNLIGWRASLVAVGIVTLLMAVLLYVVVRDRPDDGVATGAKVGPGDPQGPRIGLLEGMRRVVTSGRFWPISIWTFFTTGISFALGGLWGGPYLMRVYGLSKPAAGAVLSMFSVGLIVGSPILSGLSNRVGRKPIFVAMSLLFFAIFVLLYLSPAGLPVPLLYVLFSCISLCGGATGPIVATVSKELFPVAIAGTAVGTVNLFPFFGAALFQVVMGAIVGRVEAGGEGPAPAYGAMFLFCLGCTAAALVTTCFLKETLPRLDRSSGRAPTP